MKLETIAIRVGYIPEPSTKAVTALSPFNIFLIIHGLETLALHVAQYLKQIVKVKWGNTQA